ncbi:TPA: hypothetical protein KOB80_002512 [Clostridioides difficile]|nr:hypothetical protein [Clostridioides difficile]
MNNMSMGTSILDFIDKGADKVMEYAVSNKHKLFSVENNLTTPSITDTVLATHSILDKILLSHH